MVLCVLDASFALAWILPDEQLHAAHVLADIGEHGALVSGHWSLETCNSVVMAHRRGRLTRNEMLTALDALVALDVTVDPLTSERCWRETRELSLAHSLTIYDAAYLELSTRRKLPLATLDRALADAARAEGIPVL